METHTDTRTHTHTHTDTHTNTLCKKKKMFFPTLSLNLSPPRFLLWRSFSKPNRQAGGQPESWPRGPLAGETPRRGGHTAGLEIPFTFFWGFSSLGPADRRPDDTRTAQGRGCGQDGCCSSQAPQSGDLQGTAGASGSRAARPAPGVQLGTVSASTQLPGGS